MCSQHGHTHLLGSDFMLLSHCVKSGVSICRIIHLCSSTVYALLVDVFSVCCIVILIRTEASAPWCFIISVIILVLQYMHVQCWLIFLALLLVVCTETKMILS